MSDRYFIVDRSVSRHCCFEASVCDLQMPDIIAGEHYEVGGEKQYLAICECFTREKAEIICAALNQAGGHDSRPE